MGEILNSRSALYINEANAAADANGIPREIFQSLIQQESSWDPYAVSSVGAQGLTQLYSPEAKAGIDPFNPVQNLNAGARWLKRNFDKTNNWGDALSMYNSGKTIAESNALTGKYKGAGAAYANEVISRAVDLGLDPKTDVSFWDDPWAYASNAVSNSVSNVSNKWDVNAWIAWLKEKALGISLVMAGGVVVLFALWQLLKFQETPAHG